MIELEQVGMVKAAKRLEQKALLVKQQVHKEEPQIAAHKTVGLVAAS